jgi:hypothetical protein
MKNNDISKKFFEELNKFEENTHWELAFIPNMKIEKIDGSNQLKLADETNTKFANYPYNDNAVPSMCGRAEISGRGITKLPNDLFMQHLNDYFRYSENKYSIVNLYNGVIYACHSDNYKILSIKDCVRVLRNYLNRNFKNAEIVEWYISPTFTSVDIKLNDDNINRTYSQAFNKRVGESPDLTPILKLIASNTGFCGVNLIPMFKKENSAFILTEPIVLTHKGEAHLDKFIDNCELIYSLMNDGSEKMKELAKIKIEYPANCAANIAMELKLPKRKVMPILFDMQDDYGNAQGTARDVYIYLSRLLKEYNNIAQFKIADQLSRALNLEFKKYDRANAPWLDSKAGSFQYSLIA